MDAALATAPDRARALAHEHLVPLGVRFDHTVGVANRAVALVGPLRLDPGQAATLVAAAWLHDLAYAPTLAAVGFHPVDFHPLDGATWLFGQGWPDEICRLVAHHTDAVEQARRRGIDGALRRFPEPEPTLAAALAWCDLHTSPTGLPVGLETRRAEVRSRYGPDHSVPRAMDTAWPRLVSWCSWIDSLVSRAGRTAGVSAMS
ncbi:MAG: HD domain-containing protein [Acidimicrobiales bacterium]